MVDVINKQNLIDQIDALTVDGEFNQNDVNYLINYLVANGDMNGTPRDMIQIRRGNAENLPTLAQGEMAFALDTAELFIGGLNGTVKIGAKDGGVIDVKDGPFNAKGNGIADDTLAIQSAFDTANLLNGVVLFPSGHYKVTDTIHVGGNVKGVSGLGDSLINFTMADKQCMLISDTVNFVMNGIRFTQNIVNSNPMIVLSNNKNLTVDRCRVDSAGGTAFSLVFNKTIRIENCYLYDTGNTSLLPPHHSKPAIWVGESPTYTNTDINIYGCTFENTKWSGVYFFPKGGSIENCEFNNCNESSIFVTFGATNLKFMNNQIHSARAINVAGFGMEIGDCQHVTISGNEIYNCDEGGLGLGDVKDFIVSDNKFHHNGKGNGSPEHKAGIVLRQTAADTTERGIITGNYCYDEYTGTQKTQLFGLSTIKSGVNVGIIRNVLIEGNNFTSNKDKAVHLFDETTIDLDVLFKNNIGYGDQIVTKEFNYPTSAQSIDFVGFGFRPNVVRIDAWIEDTRSRSYTTFSSRDTNSSIVNFAETPSKIIQGKDSMIMIYEEDGTFKSYLTLTSFLNDGFRANVAAYNGGVLPIKVLVTAYP